MSVVQPRDSERIRIAYFSADFREHPVAQLMAAVFEHHDRARIELMAFSFGPRGDGVMRQRMANACSHFEDVQAWSDADIARRARELGVDIAVDLGGFTEGSRPGIFAARAAPVQVNFLGYPATMGAGYMDYIIADETIIPPGARQHYAEKVLYLPSYQPNDPGRLVSPRVFSRAECGLPQQGFVFCNFNNSYKITPQMFGVWTRILVQLPGSVLWLPAGSPTMQDNLRTQAQRRGVAAERLVFAPRMPLLEEHLARYRLADLFLDTLPYNAHTTASDALWAGLPLLTCCGTSFASRVAASVLHAVGLPELAADTLAEYESKALALARDADALARLRRELDVRKSTSRLFDVVRYTQSLETAFKLAHDRRLAGLPPDHVFVAP